MNRPADDPGSTLPLDLLPITGARSSESHASSDFAPTLPPEAPAANMPGIPAGFGIRQVARVDKVSESTPIKAGTSSAINYPKGGKAVKHILMVDDDLTARLYMRAKLMLRGNVQILEASNGADAIEIAHINEFDAVLLDVDMGEQNGYEVCKAIRNLVRGQGGLQPRIYMITSRTSLLDKMRAKLAGADGFLSKPPHPQQLAQVLAEL